MTREDAIYEIKQLAVLSTNKNIERITEALNMAIEALQDEIWKDEPCDECVFVKGSGWCDNCNGKPKGLDALPNSRKAEQTEPQTMYYPQVDGITPSVIEPQTQLTAKCLECNNSKACKENHWEGCRYEPLGYEVTAVVGTIKDEPQTEREGE